MRAIESRWLTAFFLLAIGLNLLLLGMKLADVNLPGNDTGYEPTQPIAFSHRLHSGDLQISCFYCHPAAYRARYAGTPAPSLCMNCHRFVAARLGAVQAEEEQAKKEGREPQKVTSTEIQKIYDALGLDSELRPVRPGTRIRWLRVNRLPDFVVFHHGAHTAAGIDCAYCHGAAEKMERIRQTVSFSMGFCVNCHRLYQGRVVSGRTLVASTDCGTCHH
ncbi:MAG: cytochrome c3 family protein [Acidobacteriota bacterium]